MNPSERLGANSINEIKDHPFFKEINWALYNQKKLFNPISEIVKKYPLKSRRVSQISLSEEDFIEEASLVESPSKKNKNRKTKCEVSSSQEY